ncbi:MAG: ATP-binding cassette domain-containing protein [Eubacterium sp.]|nr:ATP-binding cassette domain-containing protein [Eubacterium sp.]
MSQIDVCNLTFCYEGSFDNIFENVSFSVDTDWKLGFIGRNGKGKTTFLHLLLGKNAYEGAIRSSAVFDYFPYQLPPGAMQQSAAEFYEQLKAEAEWWKIICELEKLQTDAEVLYRPFGTLSHGERTKVMLAILFSGENDFLLIDEPTNHLDQDSREIVKAYLAKKKGFILVSHDRDLLDACVDHVLVLNRCTIEVQQGNFSSWWENKTRMDAFYEAENEKHRREISKLQQAAGRTRKWADQNEKTKIGFDPRKEPDRCIGTRAYIGAKTKKMQSRVKQIENRISREIEEKEGLLKDIEHPAELKLMPLRHHKDMLVLADDFGLRYTGADHDIFAHLHMELRQGERVFLCGSNGCGKSSLMKAILRSIYGHTAETKKTAGSAQEIQKLFSDQRAVLETGMLKTASGLSVSYVSQDTSFLKGSISEFCKNRRLEESLFCALLRQLDLERVQFAKDLEEFSEGQKKKVLLAASLMTPAHLYIWDEPLNYIDVFSRMQIEKLILNYGPTMLVAEHDAKFREKIATQEVIFQSRQPAAL